MSDMGFTAHQHKKAISRRIRYIKYYVQYALSPKVCTAIEMRLVGWLVVLGLTAV